MKKFLEEILQGKEHKEEALVLAMYKTVKNLRKREEALLRAQDLTASHVAELRTIELATWARGEWEYKLLSPYRKLFDFPPSGAKSHHKHIRETLKSQEFQETCLPDVSPDFPVSQEDINHRFFIFSDVIEQNKGIIPPPGERQLQDFFSTYFLNPIIKKYNESKDSNKPYIEPKQRISFVSLGERCEADMFILSQNDKLTIMEIKKNDEELTAALYQAALYALLYQISRKVQGTFCISLVALSLPDITACIGSFEFTLSGPELDLENPRLNLGRCFGWKNPENQRQFVAYLLSEPSSLQGTSQKAPSSDNDDHSPEEGHHQAKKKPRKE